MAQCTILPLLPTFLATALLSAPQPRRLNSVVTELAEVAVDARPAEDSRAASFREIPFTRTRGGWVYIALHAELAHFEIDRARAQQGRASLLCLAYPGRVITMRQLSVVLKVLLDMQFHALANEPAFEDLWGGGFWSGHYIDEELMRWYAAMFRHYLIEGGRERLSQDPYILRHLDNPGFEDGDKGRTFQPAAGGSVEAVPVERMPQSGAKQKYCPVPEGKHVLRTRRTGAQPNVFSQTIKRLEPGRLYSLRLYKTAPGYSNRLIPASITLRRVLPQTSRTLDHVWKKGEVYWNYHYRVFRADSGEARLDIADGEPGEVFWDFVQVEPYFEE